MASSIARHRSTNGPKRNGHQTQLASSADQIVRRGRKSEEQADDPPKPKTETEVQLEKLLFGGTEFHNTVRDHDLGIVDAGLNRGSESPKGWEEGEGDMADVTNDDLFFLDFGNGDTGNEVGLPHISTPADAEQLPTYANAFDAWEDSDDERLRISLVSNDRLKKLRVTEAEDVVSGRDYISRLRKQFESLQPTPQWATESDNRRTKRRRTRSVSSHNGSDEDGLEDETEISSKPLSLLLQNSTSLTNDEGYSNFEGKSKLREEVLEIERLKDVGGSQPSTIETLSFHPHYPILLSSGPASTLFLHQISPQSAAPNPLLTSLHVRRTPVRTSAFSAPSGNRIFFSGRRRYFHVWNLDSGTIEKVNTPADRREEQKSMERFKLSPCGRWMGIVGTTKKGGGIVTVLDAATMQWISQVRVDSRNGLADFAWWSDGEGMCVVGKNGQVSEWDRREKQVIATWIDEGAVGTTVLSLGGKSSCNSLGGDRWVAIGSSSGIVNIYDRLPWQMAVHRGGQKPHSPTKESNSQFDIPRQPKPTRMLDQLTTPVSHLVFANDGQFLVVASRWKKGALKLVHLPSCTIYKNWPTPNTPLGRISAVAIAGNSRTLAVANEQGRIRLWEIRG